MISPHLLSIIESFSSSHLSYMDVKDAESTPDYLGWEDRPLVILADTLQKDSTWMHAILAEGPPLNDEKGAKVSALVVIWWSKMSPDTQRVLSIVDWEKQARNYREAND